MELYPAVDVRGGRLAHIRTGPATAPSVYGHEPAAAITRLAAEGARWVHLVDLDRAYGTGSNRALVRDLLTSAPLRVQIGGSLGAPAAIEEMLGWGAARVIVGGAAAAAEPNLVGPLVSRHGAAVLAVAIDTTKGRVTPRGGGPAPSIDARELARRVMDQGITTVVHTDVIRDGTLQGPDLEGAQTLAALGLEVIVSGGVGSIADVRATRGAGLAGVIVGRALHEGRFTFGEAVACAAG